MNFVVFALAVIIGYLFLTFFAGHWISRNCGVRGRPNHILCTVIFGGLLIIGDCALGVRFTGSPVPFSLVAVVFITAGVRELVITHSIAAVYAAVSVFSGGMLAFFYLYSTSREPLRRALRSKESGSIPEGGGGA